LPLTADMHFSQIATKSRLQCLHTLAATRMRSAQ
jgi:hypothetical protein